MAASGPSRMNLRRKHHKLSWDTHKHNFVVSFTSYLNSTVLCDVTLSAEGQHISAHRLVLSACSNYFLDLFTRDPYARPIIVINDVSYCDLKVLVHFMYYGEADVPGNRLREVIEAGKKLKIRGIIENADQNPEIIRMLKPPPPPPVKKRSLLNKRFVSQRSMKIVAMALASKRKDPEV